MPTIQQLVRSGRTKMEDKSKSPALAARLSGEVGGGRGKAQQDALQSLPTPHSGSICN